MSRDFSTVVDDFAPEKASSNAPSLHFDVKRFINMRLPVILIIGVVLAIPLSLAGWFLTPVEFTATAQIHYRSLGSGIVEDERASSGDYSKFVNTEIAKLTGDNIMLQVLQRPEITSLPSVRAAQDQLTFLKDRISARMLTGAELVNVTCTMQTREEALKLLQVVIEIYERQAQEDEAEDDSRKIRQLNEKIEDLTADLALQRKEIQEKEGAIGSIAGGVLPEDSTEAEQYRQSMLDAEQAVNEAQNNVASVEDQIRRLDDHIASNRANPGAEIYDLNVESLLAEDPRVATLQEDLVRLESSVDLLRETHRESHPELKAQLRQLESMRSNLASEENIARAKVLKELRSRYVEDLEAAKRNVEDEKRNHDQNSDRYEEYLSTAKKKAEEASEKVAELQQLREQAAIDSALRTEWRTRVQNLLLEEDAPARVVIRTPPYAPLTQGIAKKILMAMLGLMTGFGIGLAYGVLRELLDQQIRTPRDLARVSNLPIIASIPHMSEDKMFRDTDNALLMAQHPNSIIADEYRRILARILFPEDNAAEISSLLIVSASPGEGKTSLACNLAVALEHANRKVLLIDLSSQRPNVERTFGLKPAAGLADLLESDIAREEFIRHTAFENLGVLGPGTDPDDLAARLASREMMDFMEWADEHFDHIIVDSPPLLLMSDAKLLAPAIDGVLFVVGAGSSTLGMVSRCLRELDLLRANTIGVVLNGIRSMRGGYLRQNRAMFYNYVDRGGFDEATDTMPEINIVEGESADIVDAEVVLLPLDKRDK